MKVLKFGGTSVGSPENIKKIIQIISGHCNADKIAIVVSAFGGVTDELLKTGMLAEAGDEIYKELLNNLGKRHMEAVKKLIDVKSQSKALANVRFMLNELDDVVQGIFLVKEMTVKTADFVLSFGERLSAYIVSESFVNAGIGAQFADARELVVTDDNFGGAHVDFSATYQNIKKYFKESKRLPVVTGFIGSTVDNETTTLGRGGSDYTASIIAAALGAKELEIWTDVDGVMTIDPRKVSKAFPLKQLSYEEAMELSHFGAKVIYPPTLQPVLEKKIPIRIKNTFKPEAHGTLISKSSGKSETPIKGISSIDEVSLMTIQGSGMIGVAGISMRLFGALARGKVNVIMISQASSEHSISFAVSPKDAARAKKAIMDEFKYEIRDRHVAQVKVEEGLSLVAVVGENMRSTPGLAGKLFTAMGSNGVNVVAIAQGSSELNISFAIKKPDLSKALNVIHDAFFLSDKRDIYLFMVGVGTVGKTLLAQIKDHNKELSQRHNLHLNIIGLANSKQMVFNEKGITAGKWQEAMAKAEKSDLKAFIKQLKEFNLANSVFIDCTASDAIPPYYEELLNAGIAIITPNKIACSGNYKYYRELKEISRKRGVKFLFETNVGAGLPVISTLNDLVKSGDKVRRMEAVLSGTLNFIFNTFSSEIPFSETVKMAKEQGYSEPDPRIDLSGTDVARKILILAREAGHKMELKEVKIDNFLPAHINKAKSLKDFWKELKKADQYFDEMREKAEQQGKKFKYIAVFENGRAYTELRSFHRDHPFYAIEGKDNIVLFTTERYKEQPLIVKGAGAGAEVTAAGIFADIIRVANL